MALLRPRLFRLTQRSRTADIRHGRIQFDYLTGERVVKVFGREEDAVKTYSSYLNKRFHEAWRYNEFSIVYSYILYIILEIGSYLLLFFGNLWLFNGEIDAGTINQFTAYSAIFYGPLREFSNLPTEITAFVTALSHIKEIFDEEPEVRDAEDAKYPEIRGHIKMTRAYFGYNAYAPILRGVSLEIQPGEMIGIVGHSGCGKTTLVNLVMRLYDVQRGKVEIDGVDIRKIAQKHLRSHIGIVPQEVMLFDATVRENIRFSRPDATDEEVIAAAKAAGAHDFILSLPEGYNTRVGERGSSLSGGERQRIAIARALIHDPQILILDEATAALDAETERDIQKALERLSEGRTTIAIAHRLSTLRNANRIIVIDHGRVVEHGTHRELIEKRGRYYKLVMAQTSLAQAGIHAEV
jgi:ATP-binding cassette subfamily B protein